MAQHFLHFLPDLPKCAKQAPVNNMNNAVLLKSPAEARQPAWLRTEPLISLAWKHNTAFAQKQSSLQICYSAGLPIHMQGCVKQKNKQTNKTRSLLAQ